MIKKFKEDKKMYGFIRAIREFVYHLVNGKKTYAVCFISIGLNYYLMTKGVMSLLAFVFSTEYFMLEIIKKYTIENEVDIQ